ncbi:hypothetical protein EYZ11_009660 [Aspergillus tanneri]|uniref:Uncharacterized protein n=1 Tax=Aspergillus tanneri TaxID=1220188 RepID=A0A4S3J7J0_9EURO|nr:hypothetical protein EYZ11_009660 [Aspergillus tanneri]
MTLDQKAVGP